MDPRMHRFSRISIHDQVASSRKLCDRVDTWRALCTYTKRDSPASVHDSPSYFLVLEQISYASPLHPSCPQPDNVRQNVLLERSSSTSSSLLRLSIAIFFFQSHALRTASHSLQNLRKRSAEKNERSRERNRTEQTPT